MIGFFLGVVVGLVIGWQFLPRPKWVTDLFAKFSK